VIEVTVTDVALRAPKNEEPKWLACGKDYKLGLLRVILLKEQSGPRILPIWVGPVEGDFIALALENLAPQRPSTYDLTLRLLEAGQVKIQKVVVTSLRDNVYYASMWVSARDQIHQIDSRPSDAIALALQGSIPIFVTPETLEQVAAAGFLLTVGSESQLEEMHLKAIAEGRAEADAKEMEFRSYRSLPRAEVYGLVRRGEPAA
jgi:bifunctional DNase/RNase